METITWTTGNGEAATVTVELLRGNRGYYSVAVTASIEGLGEVGEHYPTMTTHPVAVAKIGKLGMTAANLDRVNAAIARAEASPEWQASEARRAENRRGYNEHADATTKIDRMMDTDSNR